MSEGPALALQQLSEALARGLTPFFPLTKGPGWGGTSCGPLLEQEGLGILQPVCPGKPGASDTQQRRTGHRPPGLLPSPLTSPREARGGTGWVEV